MIDIQWDEIGSFLTAVVMLGLYHLYLKYQIKHHPMKTAVGITNYLRGLWVQSIMADKRDILAVQTLRNWVMASSFLASTAILIGLGLLSLLFKPEHLTEIPFNFEIIISRLKTISLIKMVLLIINFFVAFYSFCLAIRYYNHVNFMINVPYRIDPMVEPDNVAKVLNLGMHHYTIGMRTYYFAIILTLWLFGPMWMILGTMILLPILYKLDRTA
jgi:uncharacterized membrane protein